MGFAGIHETQLKIEAKHGDMCRFDPSVAMDESKYELVEGNTLRLCEEAAKRLGEKSHTVVGDSLGATSTLIPNMPSAPQGALAGPPPTPDRRQDGGDIEERLQRLRGLGSD